ncbi:TPA: hypothetical protein DIV55_07025 [Patescibacteria group bacterium]|uniref:Uncharacterized protein n=1 Tax=Candidatus Gottesmanbacteria bacterium GW2011_GWA1_43_11 TaxID=1618436 RepID=A0A0G1CIA5_9BACT|nr:MAG: hypothetical protein UV59_C0009G0034 [Candidatus Gottesmanbacteria bacterium GW2011_GWA1_43_11]HCS79456.1 hypothetical protein [Patescibacteria group bacterium]
MHISHLTILHWRKISEVVQSGNDLVHQVQQFEFRGSPFTLPIATLIHADHTSPYYLGTATYILDYSKVFPSMALEREDIAFTPKKMEYSGKETEGKTLIIEFIHADDRFFPIQPSVVRFNNIDVTDALVPNPEVPFSIDFKGGYGLPRAIMLIPENGWHLLIS